MTLPTWHGSAPPNLLLCLTDRSTAWYFIRRSFIAIGFPEPRHYGAVFQKIQENTSRKSGGVFLKIKSSFKDDSPKRPDRTLAFPFIKNLQIGN